MELTGRAALITGGKRMGDAVAQALVRRGVDLVLSYRRSRAEAEATASRLTAGGRRVECVQADLTEAAAVARLVEQTVARLGRLDILINMASVYERSAFEALSPDAWDRAMSTDLRATFLCVQAALPHLRQARGRVINFSDWVAASGRPRYPGYLAYYVSKAGVKALTEALALELAPDGVLVNAIAPGPVLAPAAMPDEERRAVERATPLGRWGGADEVARAVIGLLESEFITGETIRVDGGRHLR